MTLSGQKLIAAKAQKARGRIRLASIALDVAKGELHLVQTACQHPSQEDTCAMGDMGRRCTDCGAVAA
jgi:hypothetical protein